MKFVIHKLCIWFGCEYEPRILEFKENKVNVITGSSSTGKSNILAIIDFCLLSTKSNIVQPVVNQYSEWYGLEFTVGDQFYAVARPAPSIEVPTPHAIISNEPIKEYPDATKLMPVNDARNILNLAFGYKKKDNSSDEFRYRSNFIFNYLTENMINSPYDYLNYKYFEGRLIKQEYRAELLEESITRNLKEMDGLTEELEKIESKKNKAEEIDKKIAKIRGRLEDIENRLLGNNIIPFVDYNQGIRERFYTIKKVFENLNSVSNKDTETELELQQYKEDYIRTSIQLNNILRAKDEFEKYKENLSSLQDSMNPISFVKEKLPELGTNMWTTHIIESLDLALEKIKKANQNAKERSLVDEERIRQLKATLQDLNEKIKRITHIDSSVRNHFSAFIAIGKVDKDIAWVDKHLEDVSEEDYVDFSAEDAARLQLLYNKVKELENYDKWGLLDESFQSIYDQFEFMEYYTGYKTKFDKDIEQLRLNDGKSIINVETLGSQSNYMFMHLCFFMGLHKYYVDYDTSKVAQFLFVDQPSIPYYVGAGEIKTTDRDKLSDAFKSINSFMDYVVKDKQRPFQIILIEHAPTSYWTGENQLDYFHTVNEFVNGEALIPNNIIKSKQ